jgi:hypothetical protein
MEAYHIDISASVDGIVLRSSEDPAARAKGNPEAGASPLNYRDLMVLKGGGAVRRRSASCRCWMTPARSELSAKGLLG